MLRPILATTLLAAAYLAGTPAARGEDSLFDRHQARSLNSEEQHFFGPKSSGMLYDPRMIRAAEIARQRAQPQMTWYCWKYVKDALLAAGLVTSRPTSPWAKNAGEELCRKYGFVQLTKVHDPRKAPIGAVVVYGGPDAGHVELRTKEGFVSDFISPTPYPRPLVGVFVKPGLGS